MKNKIQLINKTTFGRQGLRPDRLGTSLTLRPIPHVNSRFRILVPGVSKMRGSVLKLKTNSAFIEASL